MARTITEIQNERDQTKKKKEDLKNLNVETDKGQEEKRKATEDMEQKLLSLEDELIQAKAQQEVDQVNAIWPTAAR